MKGSLILSVLFFAGAAIALPVGEHRWSLVPDGDGKMYLVDLDNFEPGTPETAFNADIDVFFVLFTRRNPTAGQRLTQTAASISSSQWNSAAAATRFIIHGWNNNHQSSVNPTLRSAFLARGDHNVISVDWGAGANSNYVLSRNRVAAVAATVARFIDFLHLNGFLANFNRLNIVGHSLGAHIAGITGKRVSRGRVQAIFGLDPAGPLFTVGDVANRLATTDAVYTEMLATNAGTLGFDQPIAAASFYPNWGSSQPGCGVDLAGTCAHSRVVPVYAESINSARFVSRRCANYAQITSRNCPTGQGAAVMGGDLSKTVTGIFYLETNANSPFALG